MASAAPPCAPEAEHGFIDITPLPHMLFSMGASRHFRLTGVSDSAVALIETWAIDPDYVFAAVIRCGTAEGFRRPLKRTAVLQFLSLVRIDHESLKWTRQDSEGTTRLPVISDDAATPKAKLAQFVYFLAAERVGLVKIGVAQDVASRIRDIQAMSPVELNLIGVLPCSDIITELSLHKRFAMHRQHGEWFLLNDEIQGFLTEQQKSLVSVAWSDWWKD